MAAYAALVSLMQIIHQIKNHPFPPISIDEQQVESLTKHITSLQDFLERYSSPFSDSDEADPLEIRIAKVAYAAEDIIESHIVDMIKLSRSTANDQETDSDSSGGETTSSSGEEDSYIINLYEETGSREETTSSSGEGNDSGDETTSSSGEENDSGDEASSISNLYHDLDRVIERMRLIKKEVEEIITEKVVLQASIASLRSPSTGRINTMVGSKEALLEIMDLLTAGRPDCHVIPIVGMGGIGKTTLARTVYSKPLIVEHFHIRLWATISHHHNIREILCELVSQATGKKKEQMSGRSVDELGIELYQFLFGRRYLVVMDDMWGVDAWDSIRSFFPEKRSRSRVLVTTRLLKLSHELNSNYSLQMKFLDEVSSWDLFSKTVFGEKSCPLKLEGIGKKIAEDSLYQ